MNEPSPNTFSSIGYYRNIFDCNLSRRQFLDLGHSREQNFPNVPHCPKGCHNISRHFDCHQNTTVSHAIYLVYFPSTLLSTNSGTSLLPEDTSWRLGFEILKILSRLILGIICRNIQGVNFGTIHVP